MTKELSKNNSNKTVAIDVRKDRGTYYFNNENEYVVSMTLPLLDTILYENNASGFRVVFNSKAKDAKTITLSNKADGFIEVGYNTNMKGLLTGIFCVSLFNEYTKKVFHVGVFETIEVKASFKFIKIKNDN